MAKEKSAKLSLNKRKPGKARKQYGPKDSKPKAYRAQGK